ncbi:MAG: hypothetical protein ABFQ89_02570 [Chloroflexota bacterium]
MNRIGKLVPILVSLVTAFLVLAGYAVQPLGIEIPFHRTLVQWTMVLSGVALLIGLVNLIQVHFQRIINREREWIYSLVLLATCAIVILTAVLEGKGPQGNWIKWEFNYIIVPLEAAVLSLLIVYLLFSLLRMIRKPQPWHGYVFLATVFIILVATLEVSGPIGAALDTARIWLQGVLAVGAVRGMIMGIALGAAVTGMRAALFRHPGGEDKA